METVPHANRHPAHAPPTSVKISTHSNALFGVKCCNISSTNAMSAEPEKGATIHIPLSVYARYVQKHIAPSKANSQKCASTRIPFSNASKSGPVAVAMKELAR